jgi:hypothetical protein
LIVPVLDSGGRLSYHRLSADREGWYRDDGSFMPWSGDEAFSYEDDHIYEEPESPEDRADQLRATLDAAFAASPNLSPAKAAAVVIEALADIGISGRYRLGQTVISVGPDLYAWLRPALATRGRATPESTALPDREEFVGRWRGLPVYAGALVPAARLGYRDAFERGAAMVVVLPEDLGPTRPAARP